MVDLGGVSDVETEEKGASSFHPGAALLSPGGHICEGRLVREATMCPFQADSCAEDSRRPEDGLVKLASPDWDLSRVREGHLAAEKKNQRLGCAVQWRHSAQGEWSPEQLPQVSHKEMGLNPDLMLGTNRKEWKVKKEVMRNP